jgi:hypothetical protein
MALQNRPDRRKHRLIVTRNTEYHLRGRRCVGVRDLWSGEWNGTHPALGRRLFGAVLPTEEGLRPVDEPSPGAMLWFEHDHNDVLTSAITAVTRPPKAAVQRYAV